MSYKKLLLLTPLFIILSHYLAVFPHEYAHSFMAWLLGDKGNPFNLDYGHINWSNLLILSQIDENVDYISIFNHGHNLHVTLISIAGPIIANCSLFILSLTLLQNKKLQQHYACFYFVFWFNLMNLGNLYCYIPIRIFTGHGDVANFEQSLHLSPWYVYIIDGYIILYMFWNFFNKTLILLYVNLKLNLTMQAFILILSVLILFGYFGLPGIFNYGDICFFLSITSILLIPIVIIMYWVTRTHIKQKIIAQRFKLYKAA